jgi:hypothetical protein
MRPLVVLLTMALVATARAHTPSADDVVASLGTPAARVASGVERAERDLTNPRVLVVRVGAGWFGLSRDVRAGMASEWYESWRRAVPQGVIAILDAHTDRTVVRYGRGGVVVGVRDGG